MKEVEYKLPESALRKILELLIKIQSQQVHWDSDIMEMAQEVISKNRTDAGIIRKILEEHGFI